MKKIMLLSMLSIAFLHADEKALAEKLSEHQQGSEKTADDQDGLAADVQQLKIEQTQPNVIKLLDTVETLMDEVTDKLGEHNTGGETIATQTEIIEKIFEAAQQKQCKGQGSSGMLEMMKGMMGKSESENKGKQPGNKSGQGNTGDSDAPNAANNGTTQGEKAPERKVPKASGANTADFPEEFRQALDAYNRSLTK